MLPILYAILAKLKIPQNHRFLLLSFLLLSPIYLFWSRAFLIESLGLILSLLYFFFAMKMREENYKLLFILLAVFVGTLAAIVKITTFVLIIIPLICYFIYSFPKKARFLHLYQKAIILLVIIAIPLLINLIWVSYADSLKELNPIANGLLTSEDMSEWNYGTLSQKLSWSTWDGIFLHIKRSLIGIPQLLLIPLLSIFIKHRYRAFALISFITFLLGPIIFTNLYFVHDYYYYANTIYLLLALGFTILGILTKPFMYILATIFFLILFLKTYKNTYYQYQVYPNYELVEIGNAIQNNTNEEDIILIYGHSWSPEIPYYAQRKAITDMWGLTLQNSKISQSINLAGKENIKAMFIVYYPESFIKERVAYFNFKNDPVFVNSRGLLYIK
ncbi:hypothetical protein HYW54_04005 [Candidatus Gottesmanbacteria bacterium]|nr:hypothetical protein [Candidatus Gottesmanbacteria bacterium]